MCIFYITLHIYIYIYEQKSEPVVSISYLMGVLDADKKHRVGCRTAMSERNPIKVDDFSSEVKSLSLLYTVLRQSMVQAS